MTEDLTCLHFMAQSDRSPHPVLHGDTLVQLAWADLLSCALENSYWPEGSGRELGGGQFSKKAALELVGLTGQHPSLGCGPEVPTESL